jgi:phage baseplate assembly protein W
MATAPDPFGTDLRLIFPRGETGVDLALGLQDLETIDGLENLVQALTLRLLVDRGELAGLAHPRYGSRIRDLIGEPLDRPNLELLRRYVRQELLRDPRVEEVLQVTVTPHDARRDGVDVVARVRAVGGQEAGVEVRIDAA